MYCMQNIFFLSNAYVTHFKLTSERERPASCLGRNRRTRVSKGAAYQLRVRLKKRSHEERSDETTFEKTTRPVLDEIPKLPKSASDEGVSTKAPEGERGCGGWGKVDWLEAYRGVCRR